MYPTMGWVPGSVGRGFVTMHVFVLIFFSTHLEHVHSSPFVSAFAAIGVILFLVSGFLEVIPLGCFDSLKTQQYRASLNSNQRFPLISPKSHPPLPGREAIGFHSLLWPCGWFLGCLCSAEALGSIFLFLTSP